MEEAVDLLQELVDTHTPPTSSGYLLLALQLAEYAYRTKGDELPDSLIDQAHAVGTALLREAIDEWERRLSAEAKIGIFRVLYRSFKDESYLHRLAQAEAIRHERDELGRVRSLLAAGRYFQLFWHYYETLNFWGLTADRPLDEVLAFAKTVKLRTDVPDPMVPIDPHRKVLSSEFLSQGYLLFNRPTAGDEALRRRFDQRARAAMDDLFDMILTLAEMPPEVCRVLDDHRRRVDMARYSLPV